MTKTLFAVAGALAMAALPRLAQAQDSMAPGNEAAPPPSSMTPPSSVAPPPGAVCPPGTSPVYETQVAPAEPVKPMAEWSPHNQSLSVGGGVSDFVRERISDRTGMGGAWDVKYLLGTRSFIGFEAGYIGSARSVNSDIVLTPSTIVTTQMSGSLRFNMTRARVQPFVTGGAGWVNFHRNGEGDITTVSINTSTNSFVAPFGGGLTGYIGPHAVLDLRGDYNLITNKGFITGGARPDMWNAELRFGYAF